MQYKQNVHILLPAKTFEELRQLGHRVDLSRSELIRSAVNMLLEKYNKKEKKKEERKGC